jgi:hypothetical protein
MPPLGVIRVICVHPRQSAFLQFEQFEQFEQFDQAPPVGSPTGSEKLTCSSLSLD